MDQLPDGWTTDHTDESRIYVHEDGVRILIYENGNGEYELTVDSPEGGDGYIEGDDSDTIDETALRIMETVNVLSGL